MVKISKKTKKGLRFYRLFLGIYLFIPAYAFADLDPFTNAGNHMRIIMFGSLGCSLCAIVVGATFLMAKVGKVSWEKFITVGMCTAGFLGAPSLVALIKDWVGT
jgi:type IV secretory pathway VirB2 component (pilin)